MRDSQHILWQNSKDRDKSRMPVIKIAFLDVGQGDTIIITCPETHEAVVVDCIDDYAVLEYLEREQIRNLRGVIITHVHADHYKGVANLLYNCAEVVGTQGCEVLASSEEILDPKDLSKPKNQAKWQPDGDKHSTVYEQPAVGTKNTPSSALAKLFLWCRQNAEKCAPLQATQRSPLPFDGTLVKSLRLLHPPYIGYSKLRSTGLNNISIVLRIIGTGSSALLTGDLEPEGWQHLKAKHPDIVSDVLKFPHHGGAWGKADTDDLLSVVRPSTVVISVGSDNTYNHPHPDVFTSLHNQRNIRLLCTQATNQCQYQATVQSERSGVISKFADQAKTTNIFVTDTNSSQCPCAGTVILELGDKPRIVQPDLAFHESIIHVHFKTHKCNIYTNLLSTSIATEGIVHSTNA